MITPNGHHGEFLNGDIVGVVTAVPAREVDNTAWPDAQSAAKMTGVQTRRMVIGNQTTETLALAAAKRLLDDLGWHPQTIDTLVYVTQTPGLAVPASAYALHAALGLSMYCPAIEVNWSCSGYVQGLWLASKLAVTEDHLHDARRVLLIVGDTSSKIVAMGDRATGPLFGDAVSATAICNQAGSGMMYFVLGADGTGVSKLTQQQRPFECLHMDGASVFNFTLRSVPPLVDDVLDNGTPDLLLFHQANKFMLDHLIKKMGLLEEGMYEREQIPTNVDRFGNCSSASIPLLICDKLGQVSAHGRRAALFGYGAGWAWAGAEVSFKALQCAELLEVQAT